MEVSEFIQHYIACIHDDFSGYGYTRLRGQTVKSDLAVVNRLSVELHCPSLPFFARGSGLIACPVACLPEYDVRTFVPPMI